MWKTQSVRKWLPPLVPLGSTANVWLRVKNPQYILYLNKHGVDRRSPVNVQWNYGNTLLPRTLTRQLRKLEQFHIWVKLQYDSYTQRSKNRQLLKHGWYVSRPDSHTTQFNESIKHTLLGKSGGYHQHLCEIFLPPINIWWLMLHTGRN
jgi:hypothetical protein